MTALLVATMLALSQPAAVESLPNSMVLMETKEIRQYSEEEIAALENVAMNEAGNQGIQGMRYVVSCILNRVESQDNDFKDTNTVLSVINRPNQFSTYPAKYISEECKLAVQQELNDRSDYTIKWFCSTGYNRYGTPKFQYLGHYFSE